MTRTADVSGFNMPISDSVAGVLSGLFSVTFSVSEPGALALAR